MTSPSSQPTPDKSQAIADGLRESERDGSRAAPTVEDSYARLEVGKEESGMPRGSSPSMLLIPPGVDAPALVRCLVVNGHFNLRFFRFVHDGA